MIMRQGGWRGWAARMLLPVLLFVALLPRGFMPDATALRRGDLALTICGLVQPGQVDDAGTSNTDHGLICPFGLLPVLSVPVEPTALPLLRHWAGNVVIWVADGVRQAAVWMNGLGPRGPPGN